MACIELKSKRHVANGIARLISIAVSLSCITTFAKASDAVSDPQTSAPSCRARPHIVVSHGAERSYQAELIHHLAAGLTVHGLSVCAPRPTGSAAKPGDLAPLAEISIDAESQDRYVVRLILEDRITVKRVERVLDLDGVPAESRPLAVAIYAQELLRASWVEILLNREEKRAARPEASELEPAENKIVRATVERALPTRTTWFRGFVGLQGERHFNELTFVGPWLEFGGAPFEALELTVVFSQRWAGRQRLDAGSVDTRSVVWGARSRLLSDAARSFRGLLQADLLVHSVAFEVNAADGFQGEGGSAWGSSIGVGAGLRFQGTSSFFIEGSMNGRKTLGRIRGISESVERTGTSWGSVDALLLAGVAL